MSSAPNSLSSAKSLVIALGRTREAARSSLSPLQNSVRGEGLRPR